MSIPTDKLQDVSFLKGGGEMGRLIRSKEWSRTPVGNVFEWPQSLRTTLSIILHSRFPMFLFWGPELICFYNDAYRPSLGNDGKHPAILGVKGKEAWAEIWHIIKPLIDQVMNTGEATWSEDQLIPIYRNSTIEKVYWTFSYSPVIDESGKPAGVFVTCMETTSKVMNEKEQLIVRKQLEEAELRMLLAVEAGKLGMFDRNFITDEVINSPRLLEMYGLTNKTTAQDFINAMHPDDIPLRNEAVKKAIETSELNYEFRVIWSDQSIHWIRMQGSVIYDEDKRPLRCVGVAQDITEQKQAIHTIQEAEKKFRNLVMNAPVPTAVFKGEDMVIELANEEVLNLWKKDSSVIGKPILLAIPEMQGQPFFAVMQEVYNTGKPWEGRRIPAFVEKDGVIKEGYYNLLYKALYDNTGTITGLICMGYDVTDQVKHEQQKDDFIKMASHELKTPVTTVKGYIQLLLSKYAETNDSILAGSLAVIEKQISKLGKLLTDLLDVNKLETNRFQVNKEMFLIETLLNDIAEDFRIIATHAIELDFEPGMFVYADKDRITQVLLNLLANAIKYSPGANKVIIKTRQQDDNVIITVQDFGIGILTRDHQNIFDRFYRVEGEDEKTIPGFGIGLFIVKELVELHQGKVWVESEKGIGSSFHVMLPTV
jgi:PAS domain S-box-containing protein